MENSSVAFMLVMCQSESTQDVLAQCNKIDVVTETVNLDLPEKMLLKLKSSELYLILNAIRWKLLKMVKIESTLTLAERVI